MLRHTPQGNGIGVPILEAHFQEWEKYYGHLVAIALGVKGPVHFLQEEGRMNSDIYIKHVLEEPGLPIYRQYVRERGSMIWMNDGAGYHTSKATASY